MSWIRRALWVCPVFLAVGLLGARTAFIEQTDYSVEGASAEQVFEVNEWAREWFRYLRAHGVEVPAAIPSLRIVVFDEGERAGDAPMAFGTVRVAGVRPLHRDAVIDGIVTASLIRYARWRGLPTAPAPWLVAGLTEHFLVSWNPARRDQLASAVLAPESVVSLQNFLEAVPESLADRAAAFRMLAEMGWPSGHAPLLEALLRDATAPFAAFRADATGGDLWLATVLAELRLSVGAPLWNLETTAWRLEWLAAVPVEWRGQRYLRHLMVVHGHRWDAERRAWLEERLRLTKGALTQVHPVYHNAAHSLGWVWEAILRDDPRDAIAARIHDFEEDLAAAHALSEAIKRAFSANP